MRFAAALLAGLALSLVPAAASARPRAAAPAAHDWSRMVAATAQGGFRMGNPAAAVKIVEYGSLACPHCRHFAETGVQPLVHKYVRGGKVSYEFRNMLLNGPDISVSLLARCGGAASFFPMAALVFSTQPGWEKRIAGLGQAESEALLAMNDQQRVLRYGALTNLVPAAGRYGITPARARQCLTDPQALQRLLDLTAAASQAGVTHTPTFFLNGKMLDAVATWEELEPRLKSALGSG